MKIWPRFWNQWQNRVAIGFLAVVVLISIISKFIPMINPNYFDPANILPAGPTLHHWLGTDDMGRDILFRLIAGAQVSFSIAFIAVGISMAVGVLLGLVSGYYGGWIDACLMRLVDFLMAIPTIFLILVIQSILNPNIVTVMVVIGLTSWMDVCRMVRAEVMSLKERPFVLAAQARGVTGSRLLLVHIFPHTLNPVIVAATLGLGSAILTESVISFLGLGVQPPYASWGNMLENSLAYMNDAPWMILSPGIMITLTVLVLNVIGDGLRAALNPKEVYVKSS